ncbi:MAG: Conjugative relaxosome accessory transposon protein [Smithella sp. PtaU1.Bin162]|nr:MAG: Conjugative relaxosome accessory transposon protein [Smithella sp. PtaU1.Bin162]
MKKIKIALITILSFVLIISPIGTSNAGWIDNWVEQKVYSGPNYTKGQQRGYYSGGSFSARWPVKKDYLLTVQPPRIKAGCGGIDIFTGGISFMNFDYLVKKLERILQSAPAAAFDLALNVLCEPCSKAIKSIESIANALNGMSLDECKASKAIAAYTLDKTGASDLFSDTNVYEAGGELEDYYSDYLNAQGLQDSYQNTKEQIMGSGGTAVPNSAPQNLVSGCPDEVTALFFRQGSMIANINEQIGLNESQEYLELVRGFIGDIELVIGGPRGVVVQAVPPCSSNKEKTVDNFISGDVEARRLNDDQCVPVGDVKVNLTEYVKQMITDIAGSYQNKTPLTAAQVAFINSNPLSISLVIKGAVASNNVEVLAANLADPTAKALAYRMMDDMYHRIWFMVQRGQMIAAKAQAKPGALSETCKYTVLKPQIDKLAALGERVEKTRESLRASYFTALSEIESVYNLVEKFQKANMIITKDMTSRFGNSVAQRATGR